MSSVDEINDAVNFSVWPTGASNDRRRSHIERKRIQFDSEETVMPWSLAAASYGYY